METWQKTVQFCEEKAIFHINPSCKILVACLNYPKGKNIVTLKNGTIFIFIKLSSTDGIHLVVKCQHKVLDPAFSCDCCE